MQSSIFPRQVANLTKLLLAGIVFLGHWPCVQETPYKSSWSRQNAMTGPILLGQSKVDDVYLVGLLSQSDQKIIRLDVPVDEVLGVHIFHPDSQAKSSSTTISAATRTLEQLLLQCRHRPASVVSNK